MKKIIIAFVIGIFVCSTAFAVWTKQEEVDDFGDKTGKVTFFSGTYEGTYSSNSSGVSNGKLLWGWYINSDGTTQFLLQEGGKNVNLSTAVYTTDKYTVKMKGSDSQTYEYTGQITRNGAYYNVITVSKDLRSIIAMNTSLKVVISNDRGTYSLGSVNTSNCEGLFFDVSGFNSAKALMEQGLYEQAIIAFNGLNSITFNYFNCSSTVKECSLRPNQGYSLTCGYNHDYDKSFVCTKCGHELSVGNYGPSGGWIFYDCDADNDSTNNGAGPDGLQSSVCGWRYLEAAPTDMIDNSGKRIKYVWGDNGNFGTKTGIGEGKKNTEIIASKASKDRTNNAAKACLDYKINGYDDWFLPSIDELNLMYLNLEEKGIGCFYSDYYGGRYWSSSDIFHKGAGGDAWGQDFYDGCQRQFYRYADLCVRAIRAF